ncbi:dynein heavy chain 5, axonemal isoform X2 [Strongylocentrotus purpuratus]|uniref:AAA+ ATPase domain-containing protein n=1 Tax=Strongylocentrotus purpuratus TaxID=7668 RepID=A0A7M7N509_STRPU|nr:dynein heavy chain 5, axonemal isoform X1 [Strongylocentrotus purpuratus]XP_030831334.1 dynein heavy chain 5, axonemal isoform X2 [Strongylocentrotus purpuratus]
MADTEQSKTTTNRIKAGSKRHGTGSADPKSKTRLAALAPGENLKEKQQKLKEEREAKRARIEVRHEFVMDAVADSLHLEKSDVEDAILEGNNIEKMNKFFDSETGVSTHLMFFYQEPDTGENGTRHAWMQDSAGEPMRLGPQGTKAKSNKPRVYVTDGNDMPLNGVCVFFLRANTNKPVNEETIHKELIFTSLDTSGIGLLNAVEKYLADIIIPFLRTNTNGWGQLGTPANQQARHDFLLSLEAFVSILGGAKDSLGERMDLKKCETYDVSKLTKASDQIAVANSTHDLEKVEEIMAVWIKQIEQVLAESEQMRKEADNIGPRAELDHWKKRMSRFNYLLEQIKGPEVKAVLGVLQAAKSRTLKQKWMELDRRITDAANEAKDNVKFLYTLEKFCDPLYNSDPVGMVETIPGLINAIRMIHSISRYYNTSERMTSLFVKVTNQMITSCKSYITDAGISTIWEQPREELIPKLKNCITLNHEYQACFQKTKLKLESMPKERQFEFSEMYIFGKFDTFERRLVKIIDMFDIIERYSHLADSRIEGMDSLANRFTVVYTSMKKKPYDPLDQRKADFDSDYADFKRSVNDLLIAVKNFMNNMLDKIYNVPRALMTLRKFERVDVPNLGIHEKYAQILQRFGREIENTSKNYQRNKNDPPIGRDLPPISGKITWARQMFRRIQEPMDAFQQRPQLLNGNEARRIIKNYNKLAKVLMEFEVLYQRAWYRQVEAVKTGLHASLLVRHPDTQELYVNFDPQILTLIKETECMYRLGLEVPIAARAIFQKQSLFKENYNKLKLLLEENKRVCSKIQPAFEPLMETHLDKLNRVLDPGLTALTWTSMNIDPFVEDVYAALGELELLMVRASDLCQFRINVVLKEMSEIQLCELPEDEAWTTDQFLKRTQELSNKGAVMLQVKSIQVEEAANELINMLLAEPDVEEEEEEDEENEDEDGEKKRSSPTPSRMSARSRPGSMTSRSQSAAATSAAKKRREKREHLEESAQELLAHFNHRNLDALLKVTRSTMDAIRKRITSSSALSYISVDQGENKRKENPFFRCAVALAIPNIIMQPALDEVQQTVNKAAQMVLGVARGVAQWNKERKSKAKQEADMRAAALPDSGRRSSISSMAASESSRSDITSTRKGRSDELASVNLVPQVQVKNYFKNVSENKEIAKLVSLLSTCVMSTKKEVSTALERFGRYHPIWQKERSETVQEFLAQQPKQSDFQSTIVHYRELEEAILAEPDFYNVGAIALYTEKLKISLTTETKAWCVAFGKACNEKYRTMMEGIIDFIDDSTKKLNRPIKDLDDIRLAMKALKDVRENEIRIEMAIGPIEESYALLNKYELLVAKEDVERVDTLRYSWAKLSSQATEVSHHLLSIQPNFRAGLIESVKTFTVDCNNFYESYHDNGPMVTGLPPKEASDRLLIYQNHFDNLNRKFITYTGGEELFGLSVTEYPELLVIRKELNLLQKLYGLYNDVIDRVNGYYDILWLDVDIESINNQLIEFQNRCRKLPRALKEWPAFNMLKKTIEDFNETCPLLELMTNRAMKPRHWQRMADTTGHVFEVESESFCLRNIMEAPLLQSKEDIEDICISAVKEKDIEAKLKATVAEWSARDLTFGNFKNRGELLLRGDNTTEIIGLMEDSLMVLGSLMSNRYNAPFKKNIQLWVQNLSNTSEIIEQWMQVQNLWVYLEAVFVGGDIAKQLPKEAKRFSNIDKSWVKIMTRAHENTNVVQCCVGDETMGQLLPHLLEQLELCQKSLTGYLEKKRLLFPRFFFVSDPALLEILGQASDSHTIQAHLLSIFDNTKTVRFHEKDYDRILAIQSTEGESIDLDKAVMASGNVELWLMQLMTIAQRSLHGVIKTAASAVQDSSLEIIEFLNTYQAQIGLLGIQMIWTRDATEALNNAKYDRKVMQQTNNGFLELLNLLIAQTTRNLTKVERRKFETLITIHVHQRDIFDDLVRMHIKSTTDFEWLKQCRFYFNEDNDKMLVSITDVDFIYQNEFLGCTERLVITPLTDRCYITLSQALGMSMGGAPAGPAGTGKTETTKDMGRSLGKYVVVFNCSDQMDYRGLGRIYKGLAQSGSWGCFDEFNRIDLPVLSVAAQQIAIVLTAKKERKKQFIFTDGDMVDMNPEFGLFLTMNPGYAGRQELPENLKINFRTVAMMVPDRQIIIRVKLASCGFMDNIILARKFYTLYKLCEEQLTKQVHYDFGLRNILSVLRTLGASKRANPDDSENTIVMRVLRDMNLSKLVDEDEPLFLSLINDLFPGIVLDKAGYPELETAIGMRVEEIGLVNHPPWTLKLIQLFETQRVRHGMMALGPSGAGKTCCIHNLMKAMSDTGAPHKEMRMNPKAITAPQMFGRLDVATNDWTDGIFSTLWRRTLRSKKGEHVWIVLDGPVDAIWIENLNSVLDDNKTLTLANGDRIPMAPNCKIVFEPHNIDNASPATVSRNGMVYMSSSALDWRPIVGGWLMGRNLAEAETLRNLFDRSFAAILQYSVNNLIFKMNVLECMIITQAINLLKGLIPTKEDKDQGLSPDHLEKIYIFCVMWSVGALMELDDRSKMEQFIRGNEDIKLNLPAIPPGSDHTMFDYFVDNEGNWAHWDKRVEDWVYPSDSTPEYGSILVPNVDNVRTDFLIQTISKQSKAVLLIGEQGTAKTVMIKGNMDKYNPEEHVAKSFNFSSATTPMMFQRTIESYVDKRVGNTYGPPAGKRMTVFVDDINMPVINEWGDQITNEIVRQMMEFSGFYNLEKPGDFTIIADIQMMAAMIQPGGGRNDIPQRLKRQFSIFNCTLPSNSSIDKIFGVIGTGHYCEDRRFPADVRDLAKALVPITRRLWQLTKIKMLPTPAKFHYIFNLRDLSRIWQGMINTLSEVVTKPDVLLSLWKHECLRVISDRFTNPQDCEWFSKTITRVVQEELGDVMATVCHENRYFVDFLRDAPEATGDEPEDADFDMPKIYEPISSFPDLEERLQMFMSLYNEQVRGAGMDLVFFKDAMVHLVKISRIISTPRGNALLVGVGGSGKQSLTRLASFIAGYKTFQITLTRSYNTSNLMEDLKTLYRVAGQQGKGITFIFTDNEIKDESFLEYLNNVLSSGEVSNLFARDEIDEIQQELIPIMKREYPRRPPTGENLYDYFITRSRQNLHTVLCFSPVGEKFRNRALKFPGLISGCTMDWFSRWPKDALIAVSHHFLKVFDIVCTDDVKRQVEQAMGTFQDGVAESCVDYFERFRRATHVTPKSYLSFIEGYKNIYSGKYQEINELSRRMTTGLDKLVEASASVAELSIELAVKEKDLAVASKKAEEVLAAVAVKATAAEKVKSQVQKVKDKAQAIVDEINIDKASAMGKLEAAKPALEEAEKALNTIKPAHISTVRKLGKPPHLIMRIMDCVLLLFQRRISPTSLDPERDSPTPSWSDSLKLMGGSGFLQGLLNFQKDSINEETVELLEPYLRMEDFTLETAKKVCGDVAGLCSWAKAMSFFFGINKEVLPLKANLAVQEQRLGRANSDLAQAQGQLDAKQAELDEAQAEYDAAMKLKQDLLDDADNCRRKMDAASTLISGLGGEKERWTQANKEFKAQIGRLVGDVLMATGFLSYSGPFNQEFRSKLLKDWQKEMKTRKIPFTLNLNLIEMLVENTTIAEWNLQGLPNDELSIQNGIIVTKASRFPLLIDPQGQGKIWIKNREAANEMQVTSLNHKYFRTHLEDCLSLGRPLLIEDVGEELDPALDNVLEKNYIKSGSTFKVKVGDKEVDVMEGFRLYVTTKLPNPAYTPEISAKTSIIDFTVTMKGLEDQLLGRVILTEKSELEAERTKLVEDVTANKRKMKELEDNLLYRLTSTQGSLVDDESLITVLQVTKTTAEEVSQKLQIAADTEVKINLAREEFRPVATRGSILYFLITEMSMVNVMYQTSLKQFLGIFDLSMANSTKSPITTKRINNIIDYMTFAVFKYAARGLYEDDKFMFTLLLTLKIDLQGGKVKHEEFMTLIKGGATLDLNACPTKPSKWILDITWLNLVELSKLKHFSEVINQVSRNEKQWKHWFDKEAPEEEAIPDGYHQSLDVFRKLLLIRSWCPDRTLAQARKYIADSMGERYSEGVILDLEATFDESDPRNPLICFLSMGSDPTNMIEGLAKKRKFDCRSISMGQGQEVHARRLLQQFMANGGWVLLQNCHLSLDFLNELMDCIIETEVVHEDFRLWMTTEVHKSFPISLLQMCIKFTNEPPQGIKAGLKRTYAGITQDQLDVSNMPQWKPMLYGTAFLHTTVQERRKFGPLGWNIPYEFNAADFSSTVQFEQNHLDDMDIKKGVSWSTVRYMIGEIQYGGRVTDDYDKRLLNTFAKVWFSEAMFSPTFSFYKGYAIPKCSNCNQYIEYINSLPLADTPEAFGLHPNADITYQSNTARTVLGTILSIQPKDSGSGGGETREVTVTRMADDMLDKLPVDYISFEVRDRLQKMGALMPMNIFLKQEIDRMQRVISLVRNTLTDLKLAIDGTIIMNENLRDALDSMFDGRIPVTWSRISWASSTLGFWFTELLDRNKQFHAWCFDGRPNTFWMTGFFNPQGFLTAMRQEVTRAHKGWALDSVVLHNDVTRFLKDDISQPPQEGVYVYGLFLEGASWDRRGCRLIEPKPKVLFEPLPVIHIYAINSTQGRDPRMYECPIYKKPVRTDLTYIAPVELKTTQNPDHWILRGVALLCDIK